MSRMLAEQAKERDTITKALALEPASAPLDMVPELKLRSNYATIMQVGGARPRVRACMHACVHGRVGVPRRGQNACWRACRVCVHAAADAFGLSTLPTVHNRCHWRHCGGGPQMMHASRRWAFLPQQLAHNLPL